MEKVTDIRKAIVGRQWKETKGKFKTHLNKAINAAKNYISESNTQWMRPILATMETAAEQEMLVYATVVNVINLEMVPSTNQVTYKMVMTDDSVVPEDIRNAILFKADIYLHLTDRIAPKNTEMLLLSNLIRTIKCENQDTPFSIFFLIASFIAEVIGGPNCCMESPILEALSGDERHITLVNDYAKYKIMLNAKVLERWLDGITETAVGLGITAKQSGK